MADDNWTSAATTDPTLVANLLLQLKNSTSTTTYITKFTAAPLYSGLGWGRKKSRTRPDVNRFPISKDFKERYTRSPTTPLSWSGGCGTASGSGSGNVDGCEASSRSKIIAATAYELANGKKPKRRKVKTYNELKKDECLLMDERNNLKRDLAKMYATLTHHKMTNKNLKRIKGMLVHSRSMPMAVAEHPFLSISKQTTTFTNQVPFFSIAQDSSNEFQHPSPPSFASENILKAKDKQSFALPDLNTLPSID